MKNTSGSITPHHSTKIAAIKALEARIAPAFAAILDIGSLPAADGFHIAGEAAGDAFGTTVSGAGDINGDGRMDFLVSARDASPGGKAGAGAAYLIFGTGQGVPAAFDLGLLNGGNGFEIDGQSVTDGVSGVSVGAAGDVNGDGVDDLLVGFGHGDAMNQHQGAAYVIYGHKTPFSAAINVGSLTAAMGAKIPGGMFVDGDDCTNTGSTVTGLGDINGDGLDDFAVGADTSNSGPNFKFTGRVNVIFGQQGGFGTTIDVHGLNGANGFAIFGLAESDRLGRVSAAGDLNGDGFGDFAVPLAGADPGGKMNAGATYVVFGKATPFNSILTLGSLNGYNGFKIEGAQAGDLLGISLASAGDVNGDGRSDLLIGAPGADAGAGAAYVLYGHPGSFPAIFSADTIKGTKGFRIEGEVAGDSAGQSVSGLGDFNFDGTTDLLIGAPLSDATGMNSGAAYVVFGRPVGFGDSLSLAALDGENGFKIVGGAVNSGLGTSVAGFGDFAGYDNHSDLLLGSFKNGAQVVFGSNGGDVAKISANGKKATFTDLDGDIVTVKVSKGTLTPDILNLSGQNYLGGASLRYINLQSDEFVGTNITVTAKPGPLGGDGHVNVGRIYTSLFNLGKVNVAGNLGGVSAGSFAEDNVAMKSLTVQSLGVLGDTPSAILNDFPGLSLYGSVKNVTVQRGIHGGYYTLEGRVGTMKVGGDIVDAQLFFKGDSVPANPGDTLALGKLAVGGDMRNSLINAGTIPGGVQYSDLCIGTVKVNGDWLASTLAVGVSAGQDFKFGTADDHALASFLPVVSSIAKVVIKGQAAGSFGPGGSFAITAQKIGSAKINGTKLALHATGALDDILVGPTADFHVREVA